MSKETRPLWNRESLQGLSEEEMDKKAKSFVERLSLEEKAHLMSGDKSILSVIRMLIHYNKNPIPAGVNEDLQIPGILFADGPRGVVLNKSTCFPVSMARGATWDTDLERRIGDVIGIEARAQGANFFGGVCINLLRHPAWGRAQETYGEDPYHLGKMGVALLTGVQNHIMACAKHYAVNSIENTRFKLNVKIGERTLREIYLPHFRACVENGVASIMSAYNKVNGTYCGHNEHLLREILKGDWNFKGFVITDFVYGIRDGKKAIQAGVDVEMPYKWRMRPNKIVKWVENGKISEKNIDNSAFRILRTQLRFLKPNDSELYPTDKVASESHTKLALEAARKGTVLLKNTDGVLPLNKDEMNSIAIVGKLAETENLGDKGSSRVYPPYVITPLQGITAAVKDDVEILYDAGDDPQATKKVVKDVDAVIIVVGFTYKEEGENMTFGGGDRETLSLTSEDERLIRTISESSDNCIVVMEGGSAIITEKWRNDVSAILMAWYPGMEGGTALADILFGKVNPSGKLPMVFPKSPTQLPYFDAETKEIEYGYYHGYRLMDKEGYEPAFPFGFGLSYTSYQYENIKINKEEIRRGGEIKAEIDIVNKGKMKGEEVVQLYIGYPDTPIDRPKKELKGFARVSLNPNERKTVPFTVNSNDLAFYDPNVEEWIIEKGTYILYIGPSSRERDLLKQRFIIS